MFNYIKKLQYPINIKHCDPAAASLIISQYGGRYCKKRCPLPKKLPVYIC